jgi:two-component system, response regulator PdtaR
MAHTILVADDDFILGVDITDTCMEAGFEVEGPHSGIGSAMLALQKQRPDLAILDLRLEDGALLELAQKLRDERVPIIFQADEEFAGDMTTRFPNSTNIAKPCPPAQFLDAINRMLEETE